MVILHCGVSIGIKLSTHHKYSHYNWHLVKNLTFLMLNFFDVRILIAPSQHTKMALKED